MRYLSLLRKTAIENLRDWKIVSMTLAFAPFFVVLMHFYFGELTPSYTLAVVNRDEPVQLPEGGSFDAGGELLAALREAGSESGEVKTMVEGAGSGAAALTIRTFGDSSAAMAALREREVDLVVEIPAAFSGTLLGHRQGRDPAPVIVPSWGDPANADYLMAAVWSDMTVWEYVVRVLDMEAPIVLDPRTASGISSLSDFDLYVPGLLTLALMMLMFTAAASLIREKDRGTLVRLRVAALPPAQWLTSVGAVQIVLGVAAVALTWLTAAALGYRASFPLGAALIVTIAAAVSIVAVSVLVAAWLRTIFDLMTIGCFPFFIMMFFSGGLFPLPEPHLFTLAGHAFTVNDLLPTTHATKALGTIMNHGVGVGEVMWELAWIAVLTVVFFTLGIRLFTRRHLRAA